MLKREMFLFFICRIPTARPLLSWFFLRLWPGIESFTSKNESKQSQSNCWHSYQSSSWDYSRTWGSIQSLWWNFTAMERTCYNIMFWWTGNAKINYSIKDFAWLSYCCIDTSCLHCTFGAKDLEVLEVAFLFLYPCYTSRVTEALVITFMEFRT